MTRKIRPVQRNVFCRVLKEQAWKPGTAKALILLPPKSRPDYARVTAAPKDSPLCVDDIVCFDPYRIKTVFGDGQMANAEGTPLAGPGEDFVIDERHVHFVYDVQPEATL